MLKLKANLNDSIENERPVEVPTNELAKAYEYDYEKLLKKLDIKRIGETDLLEIEFKSERPELSLFVVNTLINEFFKIHSDDISYNENIALKFYTKQVAERKDSLDAKIDQINNYKKINGLVDVSHQRETVINQLKDMEMKREEMSQRIPALETQLRILDRRIQEYKEINMAALAKSTDLNDGYSSIKAELENLHTRYIESLAAGKNTEAIERQIQKLKLEQSALISRTVPVNSKKLDRIDDQVRQWMQDWLQNQLDLELAKSAKKSYDLEIQKQTNRAEKLLKDDSQLTTLEAEKERFEKEYLRTREEYDQAKLNAEGTSNPLTVVEPVEMPDEPEPKHRTIFSAFVGVTGGTLAGIVLFMLAFFDMSIQLPSRFQRMTGLPLLGYVSTVSVGKLNLYQLFRQKIPDESLELFKENIRKLRTAIEGSGAKSFLFVSPNEQEGKSFLVILLAYVLSLNQKKILLIDTNFKNNTISQFKGKAFYELETEASLFSNKSRLKGYASTPGTGADPNLGFIDIIGNKGDSRSPSEVLAGKNFERVIQSYSEKYDFIFLEAASMNKFSDGRELAPFVEKVVAIISAESSIGSADKDSLDFLKTMDDKMLGGILNRVDLKNL